ncbi:fumarylacetoacetate hydrolase family protein [Streptomyces sp. NPDC059832]|uniref:fumarylacetoacetate hydrolase family protein n=1 Tax=Streptomyces sp. NPDC059832 TaxID=3346966 RepID=UPI0036674AEB
MLPRSAGGGGGGAGRGAPGGGRRTLGHDRFAYHSAALKQLCEAVALRHDDGHHQRPEHRIARAGVRLGRPVPRPGKVIAVGFDYPLHSHAVLGDLATPAEPVLFLKLPDSVCGPYDPLVKPPETAALDYGIELAVVIGRAGRRIAPGDASGHIVGYMIANDVTARDVVLGAGLSSPLQMQVLRGKGFRLRSRAADVPTPTVDRDVRVTLHDREFRPDPRRGFAAAVSLPSRTRRLPGRNEPPRPHPDLPDHNRCGQACSFFPPRHETTTRPQEHPACPMPRRARVCMPDHTTTALPATGVHARLPSLPTRGCGDLGRPLETAA